RRLLLPRSTLFPYTTLFRSLLLVVWPIPELVAIVLVTLLEIDIALEGYFFDSLTADFVFLNQQQKVLANFPDLLLLDFLFGNQRSEEHTSELQSRFDIVCRL